MVGVSALAGWRRDGLQFLLALPIGAAGGLVFDWIGTPLPWMLGALSFTLVAALAGAPVGLPRKIRNVFIPILAIAFASAIDVSILADPLRFGGLFVLAAVYLLVTLGLGYLYFNRLAKFEAATSCLSAMPGGLSEVVIMAEAVGADIRSITIVHAARLALVVPVIAFGLRYALGLEADIAMGRDTGALGAGEWALLAGLAAIGYGAAFKLRFPAPHLFGPLIQCSIAFGMGWVTGSPPDWLIALVQVVIGVFIGSKFRGMILGQIYRIVLWSAGWAVCLLAVVAVLALGASTILGLPVTTLFLTYSPGGAPEIALMTLAAGASVATVMTVQFLRMTLSILLIPVLVRFISARSSTKT